MNKDRLNDYTEQMRRRLEALQDHVHDPPEELAELVPAAFESLATALEELQVAEEELRLQNEELGASHVELERERLRYRDLFDFAPDAYLVTDEFGAIREANRAAEDLLGLRVEEAPHKPLALFIAESERPRFRGLLTDLPGRGGVREWEVQLLPRGREPIPAAVTAAVARDSAGAVVGIRWVLRDITERVAQQTELDLYRRHLEEMVAQRTSELRASEERYRTVAEYTYDWEFWQRPDNTFAYVSPSAERVTGYPARSFMLDGELHRLIVVPEDLPTMIEHEENVMEDPDPGMYEYRIVRKDGETRWIEHICQAVYDDQGHFAGRRGTNRDITDREAAQAERERLLHDLETEQALLQSVLDQAPVGILAVEASSGRFLLINRRIREIWREEAFRARDLQEFAEKYPRLRPGGPQLKGEELPLWRALYQGEVVREEDQDFLRADGTQGTLSASAAPIRDAEGNIRAAVVALADVTYERWAVEELRRSQEHLEELVDERTRELEDTTAELARQGTYTRGLIEASLDPLVTIAPDGKIMDVNSATERYTGYTRAELVGTDFSAYFTEPKQARAGYEQVFREGHVSDYRLDLLHRDGSSNPVLYNATVYRDEQGQVAGIFAAARDITARLQVEELSRQAAAYNRGLIEASLDPLVTIAPDGKITDVNSATERVTGRSREELIGTDFSDYFTDPAAARAGYEQVFRDGQVTDYPLEIVCQDGIVTPVLYNATVYRDERGQVAGVFAAARDITAQRKIERALRASEEKFRNLVNEANVVVLMVDAAGRVTFMNPYALRFFGYTEKEVLGKSVVGTIVPETDSTGQDLTQMMRSIGPRPEQYGYQENENITRDGRRVWMAWSNQPLRDERDETVGLVAIGVDRTAQRQAEEMLGTYRESLRSLASELALAEERERRRIAVGIHDHVSQTLALCKLRLGALRRASLGLGQDQPLEEVEGLVDRIIEATRTLTFELSPPILYELGLGPALEWVCEGTTRRFGLPCYFEGTQTRMPLPEDLRVVLFQGGRELVNNVIKHAQASRVQVSVWRDEERAYLRVEDDGIGFDTTRLGQAISESQSFGLFNIRERLHYLGGQTEIESSPGQGTRVTLSAPLEPE
jgi:PAS domain S-box-containing protein